MNFSKNLFLGGFFFFIFSSLFAKELKLIKKETGDIVEFFYEFYDFLNEQQEVRFELDKKLVYQAGSEIPNLEILNQKIHTELPRIAYKIAEKYYQPIEKNYYYHLSDILQIIVQAKRELKTGFEISYNCEEKIIYYDFEFIKKKKKTTYTIKSKIQPCTFNVNTENAYQILLKKIKEKIQTTKKKLPNIIYEIKTTDNGFQINYEIPSGLAQKKHQKILKIIKNNQKNIDLLQEDFQQKQKILEVYFKKLTNFHQDFKKEIKHSQNKILQDILQTIVYKQEEEYQKFYLKIEKNKQGNSIIPDYERLVLRYYPLMEKVADAFDDNNLTQRQIANKILNFLQSISYNSLQQRDLEYFTGFFTPPTLFYKNEGDCDSKSVAFLSIINSLFSNTKAILILIPGHALIGLELTSQEKDQKLEHNGVHYILAEVAGPAVLPFGSISAKSIAAIKKKEIDQIIVF